VVPGKSEWRSTVPDLIEGPLATDGTRLFVSTRDGSVVALALLDGSVLWRQDPGAAAVAARPGSLVARREDGGLSGLNPESGAERWRTDTGVRGTLPPFLDGSLVLVAGEGLAALDEASGRSIWTVPEARCTTRPFPAAGLVAVGEADGAVRARELERGETVWSVPSGGGPLPAAGLADDEGRVFVGTAARSFVSLAARTGKERWRWRTASEVLFPPALSGRSVVFASHEAVLYALNRGNGHLDWRAPLPARPLSPPLVFETAVIVACLENEVVAFDARSGRRLGVLRTPAGIRGAPLLMGDRLYVPLLDHSVSAYTLDRSPAKPEEKRAPVRRRRRARSP
jgi:outer membrane protein assembly factor BamB